MRVKARHVLMSSLAVGVLAASGPSAGAAETTCHWDLLANQRICTTIVTGGGEPGDPVSPAGAKVPGAGTGATTERTCAYLGHPVPCFQDGYWLSEGAGCYYRPVDPQPPLTDPVWNGRTDGVILSERCLDPRDPDRRVAHLAWMATVPSGVPVVVTPEMLARQALAQVALPNPVPHFTGEDLPALRDGRKYTVVRVPTWFWTESATYMPASGCAVSYPRSSLGLGPNNTIQARVSINWQVTWTGSGGASGSFPAQVTTSPTGPFAVAEAQAVISG